MLTTRRFLKTLVGTATPFQILLACILGSLLGFLPVTDGGIPASLLLLVLLLVLDANIFLAGLVAAGVKLISIATAPAAFAIGRILIDGPTRPIAAFLANGPVTAWLGFDSYLAVGGLFLGLCLGITLGILVSRTVSRLRITLGQLEEESEAFQALMERRAVRWFAWVVFGGIPKEGFASVSSRRALPIRISGVVMSLILVGGVTLGGWLLADGVARRVVVGGLARLNGSTVDIEDLDIHWFEGRAEIYGLQISDPDSLERNLLSAQRIVADLDLDSLLRRRFVVDEVVISSARIESDRTTPATPSRSRTPAPLDTSSTSADETGTSEGPALLEGNLDEYLRNATIWKDRLDRVRRLIVDIASRTPPDSTAPGADAESLEDWLRRQVDLHGYAGVRAVHLLEETPTILIRSIAAEEIRGRDEDGPSYELVIDSISSAPRLVADPPGMRIDASDGSLSTGMTLGGISAEGGDNRFALMIRDLPAGLIVGQLVDSGNPPFGGGTLDAELELSIVIEPSVVIRGPLRIILRDCVIRVGDETATIGELPVRMDVGGRLDDPTVTLDREAFADALKRAGAGALASRARDEAQSQAERGMSNLEKKTGIEIPEDVRKGVGELIGGGLDGLFGGNRKKD